MSLDAMKLALEALEHEAQEGNDDGYRIERDALRAAIEQAQDPVAWMTFNAVGDEDDIWYEHPDGQLPEGWTYKPLYTTPRQWQGLTDAEIKAPIQRAMQYFGYDPTQYSLGGAATIGFLGLVKEIEAKLKEKNT